MSTEFWIITGVFCTALLIGLTFSIGFGTGFYFGRCTNKSLKDIFDDI